MIYISYLLFLTLLLISENNFKDSFLSEENAKSVTINSYSSRYMYIPIKNGSDYEYVTRFRNYSDEILEKGNESIEICFELDLLLFDQNFLDKFMLSNDMENSSLYNYYSDICSNGIFFVKHGLDLYNLPVKISNLSLADFGVFNFEKIYFNRSSTDSLFYMEYILNVSMTQKPSYNVSNYLTSLSNSLLRTNCFYLAKFLSKPKYASVCFNQSYTKPKSSIMIILLLFMSGDTGAAINPGPRTDCVSCDKLIRWNQNFLTCSDCNSNVHSKCNNYIETPFYKCNMCLFNDLPFNISEDLGYLGSIDNSLSNTLPNSLNNDDLYNCFRKKGLHCIHSNARSLFNKLSEFRLISQKTKAAVIAISETWLDDSHTDCSVSIDGYSLIRRDRDGHGGGVCFYIRDDIPYKARPDLCNDDLEDLWVEILLTKSKPIYVSVCYRNDKNKNLLKCLENSMSKLRPDCDFIVLGDFNICLLKSKSKLCREYKSFLNLFHCKQLIKVPTRVTNKTSSLLDHIFTNNPNKINQSGIIKTGFSDHYLTYCSRKNVKLSLGQHKTIKFRSMKNYSQLDFLNRLRNIDWSVVLTCQDVNDAWDIFKSIFTGILDEIAPYKEVRIKGRTEPWMTSDILDLIRNRDKALENSNKNKANMELREQFKNLRNKVQKEVKKAKSNYFKDKIEDNKKNPKEIWRQFKNLGYSNKHKDNSKISLNIDNEICSEPVKVACFMNNYFLTVAKDLVKKLPNIPNIYSTLSPLVKQFYRDKNVRPNSFKLQPISDNFVNIELNNLNVNKSTGYDEIQGKFLRDGSTEIRGVITHLINLSITTNVFPDEFKFAKIKPLYKKNDKTEVENFRPVSILCILSKILEKAVYVQLENYISNNNI